MDEPSVHHWVQVLQQISLDLCLRSVVHLLVLQPFCVCKGICLDCITALESATSFEKTQFACVHVSFYFWCCFCVVVVVVVAVVGGGV